MIGLNITIGRRQSSLGTSQATGQDIKAERRWAGLDGRYKVRSKVLGGGMLTLLMAAALAGATGDVAAIKALRQADNTAIARRDFAPVRDLFDPDYHVIRGASGSVMAGPDATETLLKDDIAKDPGFVGYERFTDQVELGAGGMRAAEHGRWAGRWSEPDGAMALTGVYLAMWVKTGGRWTLKSEAFVALNCSGSAACSRFVL